LTKTTYLFQIAGELWYANEEIEIRTTKNCRDVWYGLQRSCSSYTEGKFML